MNYSDLKSAISSHLNSAAEDFFMVGYLLRQVSENALFTEDGYKNIWEFAKGEFNLSTSSASRFMAINARFSIDDGQHMAEKYAGMGVSKLQEMLGLPDEELEKVTKETTVREIRAMKKAAQEQLSFYGVPKTVRPEGSLITTPGCGNGKHDCFSCSRICGIRQEDRLCRVASLGHPYPCTQIGKDQMEDMEHSIFRDDCQFLQIEKADTRAGDGEPDPCCLNCGHATCYSRCDVAKKKDQEARKKEQEKFKKELPEPTDKDIEAFYDWQDIQPTDVITADDLRNKYKNAGGGGGSRLKDYQGYYSGIRINYKKEITWNQLAKRIRSIQERELREMQKAQDMPKEPEMIDAEFVEVKDIKEDLPDPAEDMNPPEKPEESVSEEEEDGHGEQNEIADDPEEDDPEPDLENYNLWDVTSMLMDQEKKMEEYRSVEGMPENFMKKNRIILDALKALKGKMEEEE